MRIHAGFVSAMGATALLVGVAAGAASAEDPGKAQFIKYCGACHGPNGKGDGVLAGALKTKPADLTQIAKKNGGKFSTQAVARFIDGTTDVRAHGDPDMPVWGEVFKQQIGDSQAQQAQIRGTINEIATYIGTIQEK